MSKKEYFVDGGSGVFTIRWEPDFSGDGNSNVGLLSLGYEQEPGPVITQKESESVSGECLSIPIIGSWEQRAFENCLVEIGRQLAAGNQEQSNEIEADIACISFRVLELIEQALKQAIAKALEEHLK